MQRLLPLLGLVLRFLLSWSQAAPAAPTASPRAAGPTAIIDTTAGKMKCETLSGQSSYRSGQFIVWLMDQGLENPSLGPRNMRALVRWNIFIVYSYSDSGGDPAGQGRAIQASLQNETSPTLKLIVPGGCLR